MTWTYRSIEDYGDLQQLVQVQAQAWSADMVTSAAQMKAAILHGGSVIAAYDGDRAIGFCYGFAAFNGRETYLNSHMMAVDPAYRDQGMGMKLKLRQRLWALEQGYAVITWTFDPFQTRNGYLNVSKLGGTVSTYLREVYGITADGDASDRFLVRWELSSPGAEAAASGQRREWAHWANSPAILTAAQMQEAGALTSAVQDACLHSARLLLPAPADLQRLKQAPERAWAWRMNFRAACENLFAQGYRVVGLLPGSDRSEPAHYVLERGE